MEGEGKRQHFINNKKRHLKNWMKIRQRYMGKNKAMVIGKEEK